MKEIKVPQWFFDSKAGQGKKIAAGWAKLAALFCW